MPQIDDTFRILPYCLDTMDSLTACCIKNGTVRFTLNILFQSSSPTSQKGAILLIPALFTHISNVCVFKKSMNCSGMMKYCKTSWTLMRTQPARTRRRNQMILKKKKIPLSRENASHIQGGIRAHLVGGMTFNGCANRTAPSIFARGGCDDSDFQ